MVRAREHLEQCLIDYDPRRSDPYRSATLVDIEVECYSHLALVLLEFGYADQALSRSESALTIAVERAHPYSQASAHLIAATLYASLQEFQAARRHITLLLELCEKNGFTTQAVWGTSLQGWLLAEQGEVDAGIKKISDSLATWQSDGTALGRPHALSLLALARSKRGEIPAGLQLLAEAQQFARQTEDGSCEVVLQILTGLLLLGAGDVQAAERCLRQALQLARRQGRKFSELRAVIILSSICQQRGQRQKAQQMLSDCYQWFTEGFRTQDLRTAKALLEEWESSK